MITISPSQLILVGGNYLNDVWSMQVSADPAAFLSPTYTCVTLSAPFSARNSARLVAWGQNLVLAGGTSYFTNANEIWSLPLVSSADGQSMVLSNSTWIQQPNADWTIRQSPVAAVINNKLFIAGGASTSPGVYFNDVWYQSSLGGPWLRVTQAAAFSPRYKAMYTNWGDGIIMGGGYGVNGLSNDVFLFGDSFTLLASDYSPPFSWSPRRAGALINYHDTLLQIGGSGYTAPFNYNEVWTSTSEIVIPTNGPIGNCASGQYYSDADPAHPSCYSCTSPHDSSDSETFAFQCACQTASAPVVYYYFDGYSCQPYYMSAAGRQSSPFLGLGLMVVVSLAALIL